MAQSIITHPLPEIHGNSLIIVHQARRDHNHIELSQKHFPRDHLEFNRKLISSYPSHGSKSLIITRPTPFRIKRNPLQMTSHLSLNHLEFNRKLISSSSLLVKLPVIIPYYHPSHTTQRGRRGPVVPES